MFHGNFDSLPASGPLHGFNTWLTSETKLPIFPLESSLGVPLAHKWFVLHQYLETASS